jgi:hypothetical protein
MPRKSKKEEHPNPAVVDSDILCRGGFDLHKKICLVGVHLKQLRRVFNPISHEELAKILSPVLDTAFELTEGQTVIAKGHFRIDESERTQTPYLWG